MNEAYEFVKPHLKQMKAIGGCPKQSKEILMHFFIEIERCNYEIQFVKIVLALKYEWKYILLLQNLMPHSNRLTQNYFY